jgi:hypothetical protein
MTTPSTVTPRPLAEKILNALKVREALASAKFNQSQATPEDYALLNGARSALDMVEEIVRRHKADLQLCLKETRGHLVEARQLPFPYKARDLQTISRLEAQVAHLEVELYPL